MLLKFLWMLLKSIWIDASNWPGRKYKDQIIVWLGIKVWLWIPPWVPSAWKWKTGGNTVFYAVDTLKINGFCTGVLSKKLRGEGLMQNALSICEDHSYSKHSTLNRLPIGGLEETSPWMKSAKASTTKYQRIWLGWRFFFSRNYMNAPLPLPPTT
jgi:hypothetical protein